MVVVRSTGWIVAAALMAAGCVTTGGSLSSSAEKLESSAYALREEAQDDGSAYERDAQELAEEARDFRRVVENGESSEDDVNDAFRELSESYHAVRDEAGDSSREDPEREFERVTEAYLDIERELRRQQGRERYALEDD